MDQRVLIRFHFDKTNSLVAVNRLGLGRGGYICRECVKKKVELSEQKVSSALHRSIKKEQLGALAQLKKGSQG